MVLTTREGIGGRKRRVRCSENNQRGLLGNVMVP